MAAVDFLIIRNKCDEASTSTNWIGDGLKEYLISKGQTVTDLSDADASPENVEKWLSSADGINVRKAVIALDHGTKDALWGEKNNVLAQVINTGNVVRFTNDLHVYTLACLTNADGALGEKAIAGRCASWLGYTDVVYVIENDQSFKDCIWSYAIAMADGKAIEECEKALRDAYQARIGESPMYQYNLNILKLRKKADGLTVNSLDRKPVPAPNIIVQILQSLAAIFHI